MGSFNPQVSTTKQQISNSSPEQNLDIKGHLVFSFSMQAASPESWWKEIPGLRLVAWLVELLGGWLA